MRDYGSCSLFDSYELFTGELKKIHFHSHVEPVVSKVEVDYQVKPSEFVLPGTCCAPGTCCTSGNMLCSSCRQVIYWNNLVCQNKHLKQRKLSHMIIPTPSSVESSISRVDFWKKLNQQLRGNYYKLHKQKTFFFHESVVCSISRRKKSWRRTYWYVTSLISIQMFIYLFIAYHSTSSSK